MNAMNAMKVDDEGLNSKAPWAGAALIVVALAAVGWQAYLSGQVDGAAQNVQAAAASAPARAPVVLSDLQSTPGAALAAATASAASAASAASTAAPLVTLKPGEIDLCGTGAVKADPSGNPRDMQPVQRAAEQARERLLPRLAESGVEDEKAAGLLLQGLGASTPTARDALARLAIASRSPQVYGWAMRACEGRQGEGNCQMLSTEQWTRLDANNGWVWLQAATQAQARGDNAAVGEAVYRLSRASAVDSRTGALVTLSLARLPNDVSLLGRGVIARELATLDAVSPSPHLVASRYCSAESVQDANRRQICADVAGVLLEKGTSLTDLGLATVIGERVGWTAERVQSLREERAALLQLSIEPAVGPRGAWSCEAMGSAVQQSAIAGRQGELAALRALAKQSPVGLAGLAQRYREGAARRAAEAASAASASSK